MSDKCTDVLTTKVPADLADAFRRRSRAAGCTPGELLRDLICHLEHGLTWGELETNDRRRALGLQSIPQPPAGNSD